MANTFYFLDANWNAEPNRFNPAIGKQDANTKSPAKYCTAPYWLLGRHEGVGEYVDYLIDWMYKKRLRLNRLILAGHGNAGHLFLGAGLEESNAGFLEPLREWFTGLPGGERTIRIYGCGIASSTPVDVVPLKKTNPPRQPKVYYDEYGRPVILLTGNPNFDIQMIQGKFTESGQGMKFLKAIAE